MITLVATTTVRILGKHITDPRLQLVSVVAFILNFLGILGLVMTTRMVDEEKIRGEPRVAKLFGRGLPPRRILTAMGQNLRTTAQCAIAAGFIAFAIIAFVAK